MLKLVQHGTTSKNSLNYKNKKLKQVSKIKQYTVINCSALLVSGYLVSTTGLYTIAVFFPVNKFPSNLF